MTSKLDKMLMNGLATLLLVSLLCISAWAEPPSPKPAGYEALGRVSDYIQPFPHSSGADLLPFCELTGEMVSQIRCDYYVQGIADLVTIPIKGKRLACIPQGQSRTQLMQLVISSLKKTPEKVLEQQSAASLIMQTFARRFPCPVATKAGSFSPKMAAALKKRLGTVKKKAAPVDASTRMADVLRKRLAAGELKVEEGGLKPEQAEAVAKQLAALKQKKSAEAAKASADCKCPDASKATETPAISTSPDALQTIATPAAETSAEDSQTTADPQTLEVPQ